MAKVPGQAKPQTTSTKQKEALRASKTALSSEALKSKGEEKYNSLTAEEKAMIGSDSPKLAGLYPLYSPTSTQTNTSNKKDGKGSKPGFKVIGLQVKNVSDEPVKLILGTITGKTKIGTPEVDFSGENKSAYELKPGEEIGLVNGELFVNLLGPTYGGEITGGDYIYKIAMSRSKASLKVPNVRITSSLQPNAKEGDKAPSNYDIYQAVAEKAEDGTVTPKKGYERWNEFLQPTKRTSSGGSSKSKATADYAFLAMQEDIMNILK